MKKEKHVGETIRMRLNRKKDDVRFVLAAEGVLKGEADLEGSTNRQYGKNVYVAKRGDFGASRNDLETGVLIEAGSIETLGPCEFRCVKNRGVVSAALYKGGRAASLRLTCADGGEKEPGRYDEGFFTFFGPVEDLCTPWSDMDPAQCQVVATDDLRDFAKSMK
jgi:hypothetical protein